MTEKIKRKIKLLAEEWNYCKETWALKERCPKCGHLQLFHHQDNFLEEDACYIFNCGCVIQWGAYFKT